MQNINEQAMIIPTKKIQYKKHQNFKLASNKKYLSTHRANACTYSWAVLPINSNEKFHIRKEKKNIGTRNVLLHPHTTLHQKEESLTSPPSPSETKRLRPRDGIFRIMSSLIMPAWEGTMGWLVQNHIEFCWCRSPGV